MEYRISSTMAETDTAKMIDRFHLKEEAAPRTDGNLFSPMADGTSVDGGWKGSAVSRVAKGALMAATLALAVGVAAFIGMRAVAT
jgi:hypothetical protein